MADEF